jgi:hypothetical protein
VCANVTLVVPELVVDDTESTVGNASAVPAALATIHTPITTAAALVIGGPLSTVTLNTCKDGCPRS